MANKEVETGNIQLPIDEAYAILLRKFKEMGWDVAYTDEFTLENKLKVKEIFCVTSAFGGSNFLSIFTSGARYTPFFIKLKEYPQDNTDITIVTGGSEDLIMGDMGRNRSIIDRVIRLLEEN